MLFTFIQNERIKQLWGNVSKISTGMKVIGIAAILSLCQSYVLHRGQYDECLRTKPLSPPYVPFYNTWSQKTCAMDQFRLISKVGKGRWAKVYKAIHAESGREVAIKKIQIFRPSTIQIVRNEECLLGSITKEEDSYGVIPNYYCTFTSGPSVFMVMEFIDGVTLKELGNKDTAIYSNIIHQIGYFLD